MRIFNNLVRPKMKITSEKKREVEALLARTKTCVRHINETDIIKNYFDEWDKFESNSQQLLEYENLGFPFYPKMSVTYDDIKKIQHESEKAFIDRAYERMLRNAAQVTSAKAKSNRASAFFKELEFYYPRLNPVNVEYVKSLQHKAESETLIMTTQTNATAKNEGIICKSCGATVESGNMFCGKCGTKLD